jgi:hypothetical protein
MPLHLGKYAMNMMRREVDILTSIIVHPAKGRRAAADSGWC